MKFKKTNLFLLSFFTFSILVIGFLFYKTNSFAAETGVGSQGTATYYYCTLHSDANGSYVDSYGYHYSYSFPSDCTQLSSGKTCSQTATNDPTIGPNIRICVVEYTTPTTTTNPINDPNNPYLPGNASCSAPETSSPLGALCGPLNGYNCGNFASSDVVQVTKFTRCDGSTYYSCTKVNACANGCSNGTCNATLPADRGPGAGNQTSTPGCAPNNTPSAEYNQCGGHCDVEGGGPYPANDANYSIHVKEFTDCNGKKTYSCTVNQTCSNACNPPTGQCIAPSSGGTGSGTGTGTNNGSDNGSGTAPGTGNQQPPTANGNPSTTGTPQQPGSTNPSPNSSSSSPEANNAAPGDPQYTNVCSIGPVSCSTSGSCNDLYDNAACPASCSPDQKTCDGQGKNWVMKWVCTGKDQECAGNGPAPIYSTAPTQGQVNISDGITCGQTAQLDVYDKNCSANGGWDCTDNDLKGYMVWYSGDCPAPSTTATPSASLAPSTTATPSAGTPSTPTAGPMCGQTCSTPSDCSLATDGCTECVNGTCQTPGPSATPTPAFNAAMCKCDGINVSSIVPGGQVSVSTNYKVEGADVSKAKVNSISFYVVKGDNTSGDIIAQSGTLPAQISSQTNDKVQYQADWSFTMPSNVDPNAVYRVFSQDDCQPQSGTSPQANANNSSVAVASVNSSTPKKVVDQNILEKIINFFKSLIGLRDTSKIMPTPTMTPSISPTKSANGNNGQNLQLGTFQPATVLSKACTVIRFQFPAQQQ